MRYIWLTIIGLAGCAPQVQIVDTACDWVRPIYINSQDDITESTAASILAHDRKWELNCK